VFQPANRPAVPEMVSESDSTHPVWQEPSRCVHIISVIGKFCQADFLFGFDKNKTDKDHCAGAE